MAEPVTQDQVRELMAEGAKLVEVLPREEYEQEHLVGAVNIPLKQLTPDTVASLVKTRPVIVYCHDFL
jgi:rhodanese-related sulfurtransferase